MKSKLYLLAVLSGFFFLQTANAQNTYSDVAEIIYNKCASCHHENQHAPSFLSYSETVPYAGMIQYNLANGIMPPWSPDTIYSRFLHERILTENERNSILSWVLSGALPGDTTLIPPPPTFAEYKLSGTPSLTLQIPTFTSNATANNDVYNCFALPMGINEDKYLRAFEIVPGNAGIVHHVVLSIDTTGTLTSDLSGNCFTQPGDFGIGGYAPGSNPTVFPGVAPLKAGVRIKAGSKLIMQIHYPAGSEGQKDSTKIRIYFYPQGTQGIREVYSSVPLQNWLMFILANTTATYTAQYPASGGLPVPISIFSAFPHSHGICRSIENWADNGSNTIPLIRINNWDFNWQGYYTYRNMVKIPSGYTIRSSHFYDNTTNNPNNPNPQFVSAGTSTSDEMLFDAFQWLLYQQGDENIDIGALLANDSLLAPLGIADISNPEISAYTYPNPFSDFIKIGYELNKTAAVSVSVFNLTGTEVRNFGNSILAPGQYSVTWDGKNENGVKLPAGVYYYTIRAGKTTNSSKIVLMPK